MYCKSYGVKSQDNARACHDFCNGVRVTQKAKKTHSRIFRIFAIIMFGLIMLTATSCDANPQETSTEPSTSAVETGPEGGDGDNLGGAAITEFTTKSETSATEATTTEELMSEIETSETEIPSTEAEVQSSGSERMIAGINVNVSMIENQVEDPEDRSVLYGVIDLECEKQIEDLSNIYGSATIRSIEITSVEYKADDYSMRFTVVCDLPNGKTSTAHFH